MNESPRRRSPDGFDDDAIFADIVAHMNDDLTETEPSARPGADDAANDIETTDTDAATVEPPTETTHTKTDTDATTEEPASQAATADATGGSTAESTALPADDTSDGDADQDPMNEPAGSTATHSGPQAVPPPQVWRAHEVDDTDEEHFDPPPVSPLPVGDLQFWAIIAGMGGGPLLLLYLVFFNREASGYWILAAIAISVAGFALLVSRMPRHHEDDDDGARL